MSRARSAAAPDDAGRVLHVAHHALPHLGGLERVVVAETRGLADRGWSTTLVTSATDATPGRRTEQGVRQVRLRAWNGLEERFGVPFPVFSPWSVMVLGREVRRSDVVHIHDVLYLSSWLAAAWCWALGKPYVVHRHVGFVHHTSLVVRLVQRCVVSTIGALILRRARAVLPIDEFIAAGLRRQLPDPDRVQVLGNAVDVEAFRPADPEEKSRLRARFGLPSEVPLLLFVGRFVPKKGFGTVAAAAGDGYRIVFAGGDRPAAYDDPRLLFLGAVPAEEMPAVYRCVDAFVVASVGECPLTVLEAMASGLPVLVNDDPALHSPWTAGPGVVFVDMAEGELPAAIGTLLGDLEKAREIGAEGSRAARQAFSWEAHLDRLEKLYHRVVARA